MYLKEVYIMDKVKLQDKYQLFIGGEWKDASDGATFRTTWHKAD